MKLIYITKTNKFYSFANQHFAQVAELVDALDSKSSFFGSVGSIPTLSTKWEISEKLSPFSFFRTSD